MNFLDSIVTANGLADPVQKDFSKIGAIADTVFGAGDEVDPLGNTSDFLRTFATVEWVYKAVDVIQTNIAKLPKRFYIGDPEGEKKEVTQSPFLDVWRKPNKIQTAYMFWMYTIGYLELTGENFWYLCKNNPEDPPFEMHVLRPDRMKIVTDKKDYIKGYIYTVGGLDIPFEPWEIFFSRYFNPLNDYRGMSKLEAAKNDIILELHSVNWAKDFFKQGMRPSGVLQTPGTLSEAVFERTKKQFKKEYEGKQKTILLEEGTAFTPISFPPKDVEFINQRKITKSAIATVYGIPPIFMMDFSDASVLQNTEIQARLLWQGTLDPKLTFFESEMNREILPLYDIDNLFCDFDTSKIPAMQENQEQKEKRFWEGFTKASVTPNEIRVDIFGKEPINDPAMNSLYLAINQMPITTQTSRKDFNGKMQLKSKEDFLVARWKVFVATVVPIERRFKKAMQDLFNELEKEVLANWAKVSDLNAKRSLDKLLEKIAVIENYHTPYKWEDLKKNIGNVVKLIINKREVEATDSLFNDQAWVVKFNDVALPLIAEAMELGGTTVLNNLGSEVLFDLTDPFVVNTIRDRLNQFGTTVVGTTRAQITEAIATGLRNNETIEQITQRLKSVFAKAEQARAALIARTEVVTSFNAGNIDGMRQSRIIDEHKWLTSRDDDVRDSHAISADGSPMDGKIVKIGEDFPVGAGYTGWTKTYPSDFNERCSSLPIRRR